MPPMALIYVVFGPWLRAIGLTPPLRGRSEIYRRFCRIGFLFLVVASLIGYLLSFVNLKLVQVVF